MANKVERTEPTAVRISLQQVKWLIRFRWAAGALTLLFTLYLDQLRGMAIPATGLYLTGAAFLTYNAIFAWYVDRGQAAERLSRAQVSIAPQLTLDLLGLLAFIHLSGGACSPLIPLVTVTAVSGSLLLYGHQSYLYGLAIIVGLIGLTWLEGGGFVPHQSGVVIARDCDPTNADQVVLNLFFTLTAVVGIVILLDVVGGRQLRRSGD